MSTLTKPRPGAKTGNPKNQGWSLTNAIQIKKFLSPFEFTGLQAVLTALYDSGVKMRLLYKGAKENATWAITNEEEVTAHLTHEEIAGFNDALDKLLIDGIKMQIVYKNVPAPKKVS